MSDDPPVEPLDPARVEALAVRIAARGEWLQEVVARHATRPVRVVAVTKGHPIEVAAAALRAGFEDLGENYAQELAAKAGTLGADTARGSPAVPPVGSWTGGRAPVWHFIGRLQSNKIRLLAPHVALWQSVDRASLVEAIARRAPGAAVLVQVDLADLPGRGGCPRREAGALVGLAGEAGLRVEGLMGVGPPGPPEASRSAFRWLRAEADRLGLAEVSMGMSADLEVALSEGSTIVRVGSALVGERPRAGGG